MLSVEEALSRIVAAISPLERETVSLSEGLGRVLAEDLIARVTQPPKAVSAMDGYAARSQDLTALPARLKVVARIPAGSSFASALGKGEAARIFTGAPLPSGADCIVIQEDTDGGEDIVEVHVAPKPGQWIREAGLDFNAGEAGLTAGRRLTARDIGLAAAMNRPWLEVYRRPRVAILSTGDELVLPGESPGENQIIASNGLSLGAFVQVMGAIPIHLGIARDNRQSLEALAAGAAAADILVTSGGASVGQHDLVRDVLGEQGLELDFWKIAMRPGKPLMFGRIGARPMLGLPGNPVSSLVCACLFLGPILETMQGRPFAGHRYDRAEAGCDLPQNDQRQDYLRARLIEKPDTGLIAEPFGKQDSSMLSRLARADCLIMRPPHAPAVAAGSPVPILRLDRGVYSI